MGRGMRGGAGALWLVLAVTGAAISVPGCGVSAPAAAPRAPVSLVPASGVLFGARVSLGQVTTRAERMAMVTRLERDLARTLDVHHHEYAWEQLFPADLEHWDVAVGRIPLISWNGHPSGKILPGQFDAMIAQRAAAVKALGAPAFLRWFWDMDSRKNAAWAETPEQYVQAWQHLWRIFRERGATNAVWVWCPGAQGYPEANRYYPGDTFVDWVCADGYNWGGTQWRSFATIFRAFYGDWAGRKPLMVAETGAVEQGGDKARWIADAAAALKERFPAIKAFVYLDAAGTRDGASYDWRVNSSARAYAAYKTMAADPYFNPPPVAAR